MVDPVKDLETALTDARNEERGWIAANPHLAVLIGYLAGFVTFGIVALVL